MPLYITNEGWLGPPGISRAGGSRSLRHPWNTSHGVPPFDPAALRSLPCGIVRSAVGNQTRRRQKMLSGTRHSIWIDPHHSIEPRPGESDPI